jgi:serine/threonine-protein kinase RsbW
MHEQETPRGMGMFLIEALVDEAEWGSTPCDGSYARMVIRLKPAEDAAGAGKQIQGAK